MFSADDMSTSRTDYVLSIIMKDGDWKREFEDIIGDRASYGISCKDWKICLWCSKENAVGIMESIIKLFPMLDGYRDCFKNEHITWVCDTDRRIQTIQNVE